MSMYGRKESWEEELFYQAFLRELVAYCQQGVTLFLREHRSSPKIIADECITAHQGEYFGKMERDEAGNLICIRFESAKSELFGK